MAKKKELEAEQIQVNPWAKETRNLTEQARILKENPKLAQRMQAAAARVAEQAEAAKRSGTGQGAVLPEKVVALTGRKNRRQAFRWMP